MLSELLALEGRGWDSLCDGTGDRFYGELMTAGAVMVLADGSVFDRAAVVQSLGQAPPWTEYAIEDPSLVRLADDVVALVYTGRASRAGDELRFAARMSSVYVRSGARWRLALYQQTPVPRA